MTDQAIAPAPTETQAPTPDTTPQETPTQAAPGAEPTQAPEPAPEPASAAYAALAKRERKLLELQRQHKAEVERWEQETAALREARELVTGGKGLEALEKLGLDYAAITQSVLGRPKEKPEDAIRKELEDLKAKWSEREQQSLAQQRQQVVTDIRGRLSSHIEGAGEQYPIIAGTPDGVDQVFAVIEQHAQETAAQGAPELLDFDEACKVVETQLRSGLELLAPLVQRLFPQSGGQISGDTNADATKATEQRPSDNGHASPGNGARTLTSQLASETAAQEERPPQSFADWENERIRRAIRALEK